MSEVRVRFAPSPTGPLHIGGVRTALYNYLFARKNKGKFILRIEDTDQARYVPGAEKYIFDSLQWLGLDMDENPEQGGPYTPYRQSERKKIYYEYADFLLKENKAYIAFDTPEELNEARIKAEQESRVFKYDSATRLNMNNSLTLPAEETEKKIKSGEPHVIRIKIPENQTIIVQDIIRGEISVNSSEIDDKVIFKSDGLPTYHLANVVDDHLMKITHVIRGEEWIPSAPLHVLLYRFLNWESEMPQFAHLPLILKPKGKGKLSKRDGDTGGFPVFPLEWKDPGNGEVFSGYRESGFLPEALINILAFLGWNPGTEKEIYTLHELVNDFSLEHVGKSGARFDPEKAKWFNHQLIQQKQDSELVEWIKPVIIEKNINAKDNYLLKIMALVKDRLHLKTDFWEQAFYFFTAPETYDPKVVKKRWKEHTPGIITGLLKPLEDTNDFSSASLETLVKKYIEKNELGFGTVLNPLRLCLTGSGKGVSLFDIMATLGKDETINRIKRALAILGAC